jgi:hypothetical protein
VVTTGFFAALGVRPLAGREFEPLDTAASQPAVVVTASMARKTWPRQDPMGKRLRLVNSGKSEPWRTVVGVVPDLRLYGVNDPAAFAASRLLAQVLFEVLPGDPAVFALVACSLALVALVACLVPGQRAMHIDPLVALRAD